MTPNPQAKKSIEEMLQRAFAYGCEVGRLDKNYKVSGVKYEPNGEIAQIQALIDSETREARVEIYKEIREKGFSILLSSNPMDYVSFTVKLQNEMSDRLTKLKGGSDEPD